MWSQKYAIHNMILKAIVDISSSLTFYSNEIIYKWSYRDKQYQFDASSYQIFFHIMFRLDMESSCTELFVIEYITDKITKIDISRV